ncbi:MAG: divalent metal cation transporter, partial [Rhodomicrobium sp.]
AYPLMAAIQSMCARIGRVTGKGLAANIKTAFPPVILLGVVLLRGNDGKGNRSIISSPSRLETKSQSSEISGNADRVSLRNDGKCRLAGFDHQKSRLHELGLGFVL